MTGPLGGGWTTGGRLDHWGAWLDHWGAAGPLGGGWTRGWLGLRQLKCRWACRGVEEGAGLSELNVCVLGIVGAEWGSAWAGRQSWRVFCFLDVVLYFEFIKFELTNYIVPDRLTPSSCAPFEQRRDEDPKIL